MFAGGVNAFLNHERYRNDLQRMGNAVITLKGASPSTTHFLLAAGGHPFELSGESIVALVADAITEEDRFLFVASNHGGQVVRNVGPPTLWCWNEEWIVDAEFADWCSHIRSKAQVYILGQCYAGGFIPSLAAGNRLVMTACAWDEVSWATDDMQHDEFLLRVVEAIEGGRATLQDVFDYAVQHDRRSQEHPQLSDLGGLAGRRDLLARQ
jgi:hypothetical protein